MSQLGPEQKRIRAALVGAALITGVSSIGSSFMVQILLFTAQYGQSLAVVVIAMIVIDTIAKLNIWSILGISGLRGRELVNRVLPGSGNVIVTLVAFGGFTLAISNMGGAVLGLNAVCGLSLQAGYLISCGLATSLSLIKNASNDINRVPQVLSVTVLVILLIMAFQTHPPMNRAADGLLSPEQPPSLPVLLAMLLGGSTGGYIAYTGAYRFLDAGISGQENLRGVQKSTLPTCGITGFSRILTFLVVFGVCTAGGQATSSAIEAVENLAAQAFLLGAGELGPWLFGVVLFCADITTIIGPSYTSISSLKTLYPVVGRNEEWFITGFIVLATILIITTGRAAALLAVVGVINGFVLPLTPAIALWSIRDKSIVGGEYRHFRALMVTGIVITAITTCVTFRVLPSSPTMFY